jgi:hypothetical protein
MARIVVRFVKGDGFESAAIAAITNSIFSHTEFGLEDVHGAITGWLGAVTGTGVQVRAPNYATEKLDYRYGVPCTDEQYSAWLKWADSQIGKSYNYEDIAGLLFHDQKLNDKKGDICSEFVTLGLQAAGFSPLNALPEFAYLVTPETLHLSPIFIDHMISKKA